jgi:hypothetical protein
MTTVTVPREVTSQEVTDALRDGLDPSHKVLPGVRIRRSPLFGRPQPSRPEQIAVTAGPMSQAQVTIIPRPGHTDLRVTPGGVLGDLLMNTLGIARRVHRVLLDAPGLRASSP